MKLHIENKDQFPYLKKGDHLIVLAPDQKWYNVYIGAKPSKTTRKPSPTSRICQNFKEVSQKTSEILSDPAQHQLWLTQYQTAEGYYQNKYYHTLRGYIFAHVMQDLK